MQTLPLQGLWAKQWRLDPDDPSGHTVLVLTTGIERVDLATRSSTWAVDPARLAALGLADYQLPQAFDLDDDHRHAYIASYSADLSQVLLLRASLDDSSPIVEIARNLQSVGPTLEIVGDTLWFGDITSTAAGMRAWDLRDDPPSPRFADLPRQGTVAAQPEYGMVGTKLPSEIARDLRSGHQTAPSPTHQQSSPLDKYTSQNHEAPSQQAGTHEQHRESMTHER